MASMLEDADALVYRVYPDYYSADPVWGPTGMIDLDDLPVSAELRTELRSWATTWEHLTGWPPGDSPLSVADDPALRKWRRHGQHLANWLQRELGEGKRVEYQL